MQQIYGNAIGKGSKQGYKVLENEYNYTMSLESAENLVRKVLSTCLDDNKYDSIAVPSDNSDDTTSNNDDGDGDSIMDSENQIKLNRMKQVKTFIVPSNEPN